MPATPPPIEVKAPPIPMARVPVSSFSQFAAAVPTLVTSSTLSDSASITESIIKKKQ